MILYRVGPDGAHCVADGEGPARELLSDPWTVEPDRWSFGRVVASEWGRPLSPVSPGKILGIGRSYREHARELGNPVPAEPVLFLKAPSSVIGPEEPIVLPPESERVEFEGEIAVVLRRRLRRASAEEVRDALLGVTCACDVTARDLQRRDPGFSRAKSFDTFCPLGPGVLIDPDLDALEVVTRVNGVERQHGRSRDMLWPMLEILAYASRMMTLEPGDVLLTGTPSGVGPLAAGDRIEVEVSGVGVLANPVVAWEDR